MLVAALTQPACEIICVVFLLFAGFESEVQRGRKVSEHRDLHKGLPDQPAAAGGARPGLGLGHEHLQEGYFFNECSLISLC